MTTRRNNEYTAEERRIDRFTLGSEYVDSKSEMIKASDYDVHEVDVVNLIINKRKDLIVDIEEVLSDVPENLRIDTKEGTEWIHSVAFEILTQSGDLMIPASLSIEKYKEVVIKGLPRTRREVEIPVPDKFPDLPDRLEKEPDTSDTSSTSKKKRHERPIPRIVEEEVRKLSPIEEWLLEHQFQKAIIMFDRYAEVERSLRVKNEDHASAGHSDRRKIKFSKTEVFATIANTLNTGFLIGAVAAVKAAAKKN